MERKLYGKYIVADPKICHGKLTFVGTRIMVWQVLGMLERGMAWDEIIREWSGKVPREAIHEAVQLSHRALMDHIGDYAMEFESA